MSFNPNGEKRRISILGATGSIGSSTLDLIRRHPDRFSVVAITANARAEALAAIAVACGARFAAIADHEQGAALAALLAPHGIRTGSGPSSLIEAAAMPADLVVGAITGVAGLAPVLAAIDAGTAVALANKESLVAAGAMVMARAAAKGVSILPVDSEHNAIAQALAGSRREDVETIWLTASGGPFRTWDKDRVARATVQDALKHPNWVMGAKVTIDSASLMNKGLELIEAHHLFGMPADGLRVLVHPQSLVHGMVTFRDGSVLAQMGPHDMRVPIAHCLGAPGRIDGPVERLDLGRIGTLSFEPPDLDRFPALGLAYDALREGGRMPTILNGANEVAVEAFMAGALDFPGIAGTVARVMSQMGGGPAPATLAEVQFVDHDARERARAFLSSRSFSHL